jgi:hypothetical protein
MLDLGPLFPALEDRDAKAIDASAHKTHAASTR